MSSAKKQPRIRFKGFSDDWEQRKLGEFCNIVTGKLDANAMCEDGKYDFYTSGIQKYKIDTAAFEGPAITIAGNGATVGYMHLADGLFNAYQRTYVLSDFSADRQYLYSEIGRELPKKIAAEARTGNIPYIVMNMLTDLEITLPLAEEQKKIGKYFSNLDNLITLHQRKCESLDNLKKSMLKKMFPRDGQSIPEIRFPGFHDPWEQRKLGDVASVFDGVHQTPDYKESGVMFLSVENIATLTSRKFISEEAFQRDYKVYPQKGDILMTRIGDVGTPNVVETTEKVAFYVSLALLKPNGVDSYFLCNSILSPFFQKGLKDRTLVTAIPQKINKDEIGKVDVMLPPSELEQIKIGALFQQLNNLITLHQRELEMLKNIKKSILEKMFV